MQKHFRFFIAFLIMALNSLACTWSVSTPGIQPVQPSPNVTSLPTNSVSDLLPHALYYLGKDNTGLLQVFRMERDGKTRSQLTTEPVNVLDYDVSLRDGSLAYEIDNQLILINEDGSNRRILASGNKHSSMTGIYHPVFTPDGGVLAYAFGGLNLYSMQNGNSTLAIPDHPLGGPLPPETYVPEKFSPDGTKLLISVGHPPDSPFTGAIYFPATQVMMQFGTDSQSLTCCTHYGGAEWSADSSSFYAVARTPDASFAGGELWKVDAKSGAVTVLSQGSAGEGANLILYFPYKPYFAPDGHLYFFFTKFPETAGYTQRAPLIIVRTVPDDMVNQWTVMHGEPLDLVNEALWSPDASFVIAILAPSQDIYDGGQAKIIYLDGRPSIDLISFAQNLKWGN